MQTCPKGLRNFSIWCTNCGRSVKGKNILWLKDGYSCLINAGCIHCKKKVLRAFDKALRELRKKRKKLSSARRGLAALRRELRNEQDKSCSHQAAKCDLCEEVARYDAKLPGGPWAYLCESLFFSLGCKLGLGKRTKACPPG